MKHITKFLTLIFTALAVVLSGLAFVAPAAGAASADTNTTASQTSARESGVKRSNRCKKAPEPHVTENGMQVINTKTCFSIRILKKLGCDTEAGKVEQPAPPRDPRSECKGKIKVFFKAKLKTPKCPDGWIGGSAMLFVKFTQKVKAHALSISIANGRVNTWARHRILLRDNVRGWVKNTCVKIPEEPEPEEPTYEAPSVSASANGCVGPESPTAMVNVSFASSNENDNSATVQFDSQPSKTASLTNGQGSTTFTVNNSGSYSGTVTVNPSGKSAPFSVTVAKCDAPPPPPPVDNLPSMECHGTQHIWVGEDPQVAVFDLTDPDGTPVSFDRLEVTGPIEIVLTEDSTIAGGKRRTYSVRAGSIPEGTEQPYSLKLFGSSGGKQVSCIAQGTVKNNDTGWSLSKQ